MSSVNPALSVSSAQGATLPGVAAAPASHAAAAPDRLAALPPRTRMILTAPVASTLLKLAAPNIAVMMVQAIMSAVDAFYLGWLGADALAGVALVYPLIMLMTTMSAGGLGGGISSSVARALGRRDPAGAEALATHALVIMLVFAALFTAGPLLGGRLLYTAMGGSGGALDAALTYSNIVFAGASVVWLLNCLASILRGSGQMMVPSAVLIGGEVVHVLLAPCLIFGFGPLPALGVQGAAIALTSTLALRALLLAAYLLSGRSAVTPRLRGIRLSGAAFWEILRVGIPGVVNTILTNGNIMLLTSLVGGFGTASLAGYGLGARLEYLQIPLVFGLGAALVTMVGMNVGAGQAARAKRIAWVGSCMAAGLTGGIGLAAALVPWLWLGTFTTDPAVLEAGTTYLRIVGPFYGLFGLGLALYFSSQGAGRLFWPLVGGTARLLVAAGGGWVAVHLLGWGLAGIFVATALGMLAIGSIVGVAVYRTAWGRT
ncbi:MAG: MATE family efflux transporter [Chloroflexi bacterium]|nr:MATE family efflux transporter [Chloroflexota bacterium]